MQFFLDLAVITERGQRQPRVSKEVTAVVGLQVSHSNAWQMPAGRLAGVVVPDSQSSDVAQWTVTGNDEDIVWAALERPGIVEMTYTNGRPVFAYQLYAHVRRRTCTISTFTDRV